MTWQLQQSEFFLIDFELQLRWYLGEGGPSLATRYRAAMQATLMQLLKQPSLGRTRFSNDPVLQGIRSCQLVRPFDRHLLFYRITGEFISIERTMHGARDLPRRLKEPPQSLSS